MKDLLSLNLKLGTNIIQNVNKYKYLGVELNYCLNVTETVNTLATALVAGH